MAETNRINVDLDILDYYDGKMKDYIDTKVGTGGLTIDDALSDTSKNPVQNKIVKKAIDEKGTYSKPLNGIPKTDLASGVQASLNKADNALQDSDISDWAKADTKPTYTASEVGAASVNSLNSHVNNTTAHITATERANWNAAKTHADSAHAPSNAQANVIETVKVNGSALTPSNKAVDISVPIVDSALSSTSTNALQTKVAYNNFSNKVDKTSNFSNKGTWYQVNQKVLVASDVVCEEHVKNDADNTSAYYKIWRIRTPGDSSKYTELMCTARSGLAEWNFGGSSGVTSTLKVNGVKVFAGTGYIIGTFTGTGSAMTISGLSFAPSRVFYYRLITGEPVLIAKRNGNGFNIDTSINTAEYEYIAFR